MTRRYGITADELDRIVARIRAGVVIQSDFGRYYWKIGFDGAQFTWEEFDEGHLSNGTFDEAAARNKLAGFARDAFERIIDDVD